MLLQTMNKLPNKHLQSSFYIQMHSYMHIFLLHEILFEKVLQWLKNRKATEQADLQFYKYYCSKCLFALCIIMMFLQKAQNHPCWEQIFESFGTLIHSSIQETSDTCLLGDSHNSQCWLLKGHSLYHQWSIS